MRAKRQCRCRMRQSEWHQPIILAFAALAICDPTPSIAPSYLSSNTTDTADLTSCNPGSKLGEAYPNDASRSSADSEG